MKDFAYIKKYKPILNLCLEILTTIICCFILFALNVSNSSNRISFIICLIITIIATSLFFLALLFYVIFSFKRQKEFNKKNPNKCAIKIDETNKTFFLTNKRMKISFDDILDFYYEKTCQREFFEGYFNFTPGFEKLRDYMIKKSLKKSLVGNLKLKLKNKKIITIERIWNIEKINKKLELILKN